MDDVMPKTDEHAAVRERFHKWCRDEGIDAAPWMPDQPWCGYSNPRVNDYWTGFLAAHASGVPASDSAALIAAAEKHADAYESEGIPAQDVRASIQNAFFAGSTWAGKAGVPKVGK